jgi:AraC-like DNA-binding protein
VIAFIDQPRQAYGVEAIWSLLQIAPSACYWRRQRQQDPAQRLARALAMTRHGVAHVAPDVRHEPEAALNRAFTREHGLPPARYRKGKTVQRAGALPDAS